MQDSHSLATCQHYGPKDTGLARTSQSLAWPGPKPTKVQPSLTWPTGQGVNSYARTMGVMHVCADWKARSSCRSDRLFMWLPM